jgi:hypothetical protein
MATPTAGIRFVSPFPPSKFRSYLAVVFLQSLQVLLEFSFLILNCPTTIGTDWATVLHPREGGCCCRAWIGSKGGHPPNLPPRLPGMTWKFSDDSLPGVGSHGRLSPASWPPTGCQMWHSPTDERVSRNCPAGGGARANEKWYPTAPSTGRGCLLLRLLVAILSDHWWASVMRQPGPATRAVGTSSTSTVCGPWLGRAHPCGSRGVCSGQGNEYRHRG